MIRNIITNFSARLAVAVLNFFMVLLTTHRLGMESRGEISTIMLAISIIHLVSDLAGGPSLVYLVPRARLSVLILAGSAWSVLATFVTGYILIKTGRIPVQYSTEVFIIGILISLHSLNQNILLGQERIRAFSGLFLFQGLVMFGTFALAIFVLHKGQSYPYIYSCMIGYGVSYLLGLWLVSRKWHTEHIRESRSVLALLFLNGFYTQAASLGLNLAKSNNYQLLQTKMPKGLKEVGLYSTAFSLGEAILLLSASVSAIVLSRVANNEDPEAERESVLRFGKYSMALTVLALLAFMLLPVKFYVWLLGAEATTVKSIFSTLCPGIAIISFSSVFSHYYSGAGKHYMNFISSILAFGFVYFCASGLIDHYGTNGAGWTSSIAYGILASFIVLSFLFLRSKKGEWKVLLPSSADMSFIKKFMNKNSGI